MERCDLISRHHVISEETDSPGEWW